MARPTDSYRGARKRAAKSAGADWGSLDHQKVRIKPALPGRPGKALPLKAVTGEARLKPSSERPGKFELVEQPKPAFVAPVASLDGLPSAERFLATLKAGGEVFSASSTAGEKNQPRSILLAMAATAEKM